jgi:heterotetrameric sarcosine oxidase delta subunit
MLLIPCPWCGPRDHVEFTSGGDATVAWPKDTSSIPEQDWLDTVYLRDNPRGAHLEWWQHHAGCRAWIKVRRDTLTHEISGAAKATDALGR